MMASFKGKITLRFAFLVTSTTALVLILGGWLFWRLAINGLDYLNHAEFVEVSDRLGPENLHLSANELEKRMLEHAQIDASLYFFQVYRNDGAVLFRSPNMGRATLPTNLRASGDVTDELTGIGAVRIGNYRYGELRVQIASPLEQVSRLSREFLKVSLILLSGVAVASVGLGWQFARITLQPVRNIQETAHRIRADNLSARIPVPAGRDELSALAILLNQMFDRLEESFQQVRRFTAEASHELKTPLALIRLNAEKLHFKLAGDNEAATTCSDLLESIDELNRIIDVLLFLAKAEGGVLAPKFTGTSAQDLIKSFSEDAKVLADDSGNHFQLIRSDFGLVKCETTLIRQLLLNLITNALRVSPPGARVELASIIEGNRWSLVVRDEGPGVPEEELEHIFERFVRYLPTAGHKGHGLGLAICRSVAVLHKGTIRAENNRSKTGLSVIVNLDRIGMDLSSDT